MKKLNTMFLAGALLAGAAVAASADTTREIGRSQGFTIIRASETYDLAPTREENGVYKLRPTQNEQPGSEQNTIAFFKGTTRALYVSRKSGPINEGTAMQSFPVDDVQC